MTRLSVVITVCNEGHLLRACLESVKWADEIVIVDMHSQDDSAALYRQYTDKVFFHPREIIAELVHNFGFSKATGDWVLKLDPDERVLPALGEAIRRVIASESEFAAYRLPFRDMIFGRWIQYTGWQGNRTVGLVRLFQREKVTWVPEVHSTPQIDGPIGAIVYDPRLDNAVLHLNYTDIAQYLEKFNRYTTAEAMRLHRLGRPFHWLKLFYQPGKEFFRRYVQLQGYRDGIHGLILSLLQSFYIMVSYMKLWEIETRPAAQSVASPQDASGKTAAI